ncbi:valine--tRNA ligase [Methyloceanibacter caenitepidi]|uniref:Valine--tRNA ligase n=1 Tax=Methyloceanibacter caenitepidi TaxID=1384459 RepID=A0A0A8K383_9HYPH|nr:valine--tRNA ligase [Methyloceanibacter caenitepidi]BAQ17266.1 valyl-tRNA synthetase [Methyloceanibacter caenitepidi]
MLDKTYQPKNFEGPVYEAWERARAFAAGRGDREDARPFAVVIPPPNVTGSLHMGHALNNTLQDVLVRFERMRGRDVLWQPGTDHAGIATQMVVERQLMERQEPNRRTLGREKFIERIWQWKEESGNTIIGQLKRLGCSCDWSRQRFTMDEGLSKAVRKVFVELHAAGLIYKDKRLVNWDPQLLTAISDLEVEQVESKGHLWHLRYPIEGMTFDPENPSTFIVVATTRPETMLGDTAVAVHPDDERYRHLVGKNVILPVVGRRIPIVADEYSDPEKGSGAVKITPAHDFNDFEVGKRHGLPMINVLSKDARLDIGPETDFMLGVEMTPQLETKVLEWNGVFRFAARTMIVECMENNDYLEKIEPHVHAVPHGDRSGAVIEPFLTDQWYVDAATLAKPAIEAVRSGRTTFAPKNWESTYFHWMENIQPWCISRQLWWGHQIPAWYGPDGEVFVAENESAAKALAKEHYGKDEPLTRDEDVLDTWFSSALWPFSTLGWPDKTPELARYYPTDVLVTGFDIIFFWIARMMMMGLHFMDEVPFRDIYIHALVRDAKGQKMSKSKGNVIDPLELIDAYGADALRFTLAAMAAQGRDIKLSSGRVEGYRNFATKLWNASRFAMMNDCIPVEGFDPKSAQSTLNRWIAGEMERAVSAVTEALEGFRFNEAAGAIYHFIWHIYCDWYLELIKPVLAGEDEAAKAETRAMAAYVLDTALQVLHPFMPFVTEELWEKRAPEGTPRQSLLMLTDWPTHQGLQNATADEEIGWVIRLVTDVRSVRAEMNVPAGAKVPLVITGADDKTKARIAAHLETVSRLARIESIELADTPPAGSVQIVLDEATIALPLEGVIDIDAEADRLKREIDKVGAEITQIDAKLANDKFVSRAPQHVVEEQRERRADAEATASKLTQALKRLEAAL